MSSSESSRKILGNTRPKSKQISPAVHWCFTYHLPDEITDEEKYISSIVKGFKDLTLKGICGYELGESGQRRHIQGYMHFKNKVRPMGMGMPVETHWEKCKGNSEQNREYCKKESRYFFEWGFPKALILIEPKGWQVDLLNLIQGEVNPREILWFVGEGNIGKSAMCKYLVAKEGALLLGSKSSDMKYAIVSYVKERGYTPHLVVMDIPLSKSEYISYEGIESIKNMLFFSPKYESSMVCGNPPHIVVFANRPPDRNQMSIDRFNVFEIGNPFTELSRVCPASTENEQFQDLE